MRCCVEFLASAVFVGLVVSGVPGPLLAAAESLAVSRPASHAVFPAAVFTSGPVNQGSGPGMPLSLLGVGSPLIAPAPADVPLPASRPAGTNGTPRRNSVPDPGHTVITDRGQIVAGGHRGAYLSFYANHGNDFVSTCTPRGKGSCALGTPDRSEGICQGTALLAHVSTRTSEIPQGVLDNPRSAQAALQAACDRKWNVCTDGPEDADPSKVLDRVRSQVTTYGSAILNVGFSNLDDPSEEESDHVVLVTEVRSGKAIYTRPDGSTEERPALIFDVLDPNLLNGFPEDSTKQQAYVQFPHTGQVSMTRDYRQYYQPDDRDRSVAQIADYLTAGQIANISVDDLQVRNAVRVVKTATDYVARPTNR